MARKPLSLPFSRQRLTETRELRGLSISKLAQRCAEQGHDVHHSAIGKVEGGINGPSPELLKALAAALGVPIKDLLEAGAA